ncbi:conserved hypothetical protein [Vibrio phage 191E37-1]|nr:conserved hypothetical protein [Vibrio phage 191E37-1]
MKNKKVKQMICSVLNRYGHEFSYYAIWAEKNSKYNYALRLYGQPLDLSKACRMVVSKDGYTYK